MSLLFGTPKSPLDVLVMEAEKTLYKGTAESLTSENEHGRFDILPDHRSFISIIRDIIIIHLKDNKDMKFSIDKGVLKCTKNKVEIIVGLESI